MNLAAINSPGSAFVAGLVTSLHCAVMCGPIACWLAPKKNPEDATIVYSLYQGTRLLSYGILGAVMGALGQWPLSLLRTSAWSYLPWLTVGFFLVVAAGLDRRLKKPDVFARISFRLHQTVRGRSDYIAAMIVGSATPLLPCGPLYLVAVLAGLSGSALKGSEFMLAFGLGTLPLLWITQTFFAQFRQRMRPVVLSRLQRGIALAAALVIAWRLRATVGIGSDPLSDWVCAKL